MSHQSPVRKVGVTRGGTGEAPGWSRSGLGDLPGGARRAAAAGRILGVVPATQAALCSCRFPTDGFLLLALLLYAPVGLCLLVLRVFIGVHVFLVSCALPDSVVRRCVTSGGSGVLLPRVGVG